MNLKFIRCARFDKMNMLNKRLTYLVVISSISLGCTVHVCGFW